MGDHENPVFMEELTSVLGATAVEWSYKTDCCGADLALTHAGHVEKMVDRIAELGPEGIDLYPGNYDEYMSLREERREQVAQAAAGQARRVAELERFIDRFRAKNTKARQVQSRVKQLERMERIERPGRRRKRLTIRLPEPARSGRDTIRLEGVRKAWPREDGGETVVYRSLDVAVERGERVALVGVNGAGKSTLLKVLAGATPIQGGQRQLGYGVSLHHYAQHQTDALHPGNTVADELRAVIADPSETRVRGLAGAFLFPGEEADKRIAVLSGGEKARVALAKMLARPANLLLLDEPTNHLDLESREVLEAALVEFQGTIVFVSHDRYFINRVATRVVEIRVGGIVESFPGDYDYWQWKRAALAEQERSEAPRGGRPAKDRPRSGRAGLSKNARRRLKESVRTAEAEVAGYEARIAGIDASLEAPEVFSDPEQVAALTTERGSRERALEKALAAWEKLSGELAADDVAREA